MLKGTMMSSSGKRLLEAQILDERILACIHAWRKGIEPSQADIDQVYVETARHQLRYNEPYRQYAAALGYRDSDVTHWHTIPVVPASAFKDAILTSFDSSQAQRCFQTSGTSGQRRGRHFFETTQLYDAAALAIFQRMILMPMHWEHAKIRMLHLTPDSQERPDSSLGHMVAALIREWGDPFSQGFIHNDTLAVEEFVQALAATAAEHIPVCIIGTALAFSQFLAATALSPLPVSSNTIVLETGGFKGRRVHLDKATLYAQLSLVFQIPQERIIAELGMTELSSQYYDTPDSRKNTVRHKSGPPWLRTRIVDAQGRDVAPGTIGLLRHYDLANRSSVIAIETEDLALARKNDFIFIGREAEAELRGCSLEAEDLQLFAERVDEC